MMWLGHIRLPTTLKQSTHKFYIPKHYRLEDLLDYQAAVVLPYSITSTRQLETYELNIPMLVPTPRFAIELGLFNDRTVTSKPQCPKMGDNQHAPAHHTSPYEYSPNARFAFDSKLDTNSSSGKDEAFWSAFSEVYVWPCVTYFDSWQALLNELQSLTSEKRQGVSDCMRHANKWRQYELQENWCWVLQRIDPFERELPTSHKEAVLQLYHTNGSLLSET
jgi:hypothetical protein